MEVTFYTQDASTESEIRGVGQMEEDVSWVGDFLQLPSPLSAFALTSVEHLYGGPLVLCHQFWYLVA